MTLNRRNRSGSPQFSLRAGLWMIGAVLALAAVVSRPVQTSAQQNKNPDLAREIRHQLGQLPFYSAFDFITFTLDGKHVTLTGQVVRPSLKKHAEEVIKSLEGVETVNDQIEVLPKSERDDELRRAIYRAIYEDAVLEGYAVQAVPPIHIIVKDGSVTLEGTVNSAADKSLAAKRAGTVENIVGVKNNLKLPASRNAAE